MKNRLMVKQWFADKNSIDGAIIGILKVTEKAVQIATGSGWRISTHWIPKSCLEIVDDQWSNERMYKVLPNECTLDEAIELNMQTFEYCLEAQKNEYSMCL